MLFLVVQLSVFVIPLPNPPLCAEKIFEAYVSMYLFSIISLKLTPEALQATTGHDTL